MGIKINQYFLYVGVLWTVLFAGMSFYWAMGGMNGVKSLGGAIYEQALHPDPAFIIVVWITGFIKLLGAILLLMLLVNWRNSWIKKVLYFIIKSAGILLFVYGLVNFITIALHALGILDLELDRYATFWRLLFWEPYWMAGGLFYFFSLKKEYAASGHTLSHKSSERFSRYNKH
ncbi:hypothetical protein BLX87_23730 [Bacillus sp. VT-16-64]|nr:hypothetical protein BLX87_23730 [Bacillus sp. VT-16-64]